jgi:hypothetical protein
LCENVRLFIRRSEREQAYRSKADEQNGDRNERNQQFPPNADWYGGNGIRNRIQDGAGAEIGCSISDSRYHQSLGLVFSLFSKRQHTHTEMILSSICAKLPIGNAQVAFP